MCLSFVMLSCSHPALTTSAVGMHFHRCGHAFPSLLILQQGRDDQDPALAMATLLTGLSDTDGLGLALP